MSSKAWYKPTAMPRLIAKFVHPPPPSSTSSIDLDAAAAAYDEKTSISRSRRGDRAVEVWTTTCIVTNFGLIRRDDDDDDDVGDVGESSFSPTDDHRIRIRRQNRPHCSVLINPSNPQLTGPRAFPYFPRGGPQPTSLPDRQAHHIMGYVSRWGGMDVGSGMLFAAQTVDGLVHQLGGTRLRAECSLVVARRRRGGNNPSRHDVDCYDRCPVGTAVVTSSGGNDLRRLYDAIIHTTPPFYDHPPPSLTMTGVDDEGYESRRLRSRELLGSCYRESFELAFGDAMSDDMVDKREYDLVDRMRNSMRRLLLPRRPKGHSPTSADVVLSRRVNMRVAVPLLGAGCRAFPKDVALDVAANEAASWLLSSSRGSENKDRDGGRNDSVVFGLLEEDDAVYLSARLNRLLLHR